MNDKTKQALEQALEALEDYAPKVCGAAITAIKEALAEPKQYDSMELHVTHSIVAGVLYDFMGWLTTRRTRMVLSDKDNASPAVDAIVDFAKMRGLMLEDAQVEHWHKVLVAPPKAEQPAQHEQDRQIDQLIQERDHRDEIIDKLCDAVLGPDRYEWSSQYFFEDAVREVEEHMAALEQPAQQQEPVAYIRKDQLQKAAQSPMLCEVTPEPRQDRIGIYTTPPASKPLFREFIQWANEQGYDCAHTCNSDTGEWIALNPMTDDLWKAWQAAHGITGEKA